MILGKQIRRKQQRGIAMIMAILALLLLAVIGAAFMMMNTTENSSNGNYKDSQRAYFASRAGLEDVRAILIENAALNAAANNLTMPTTTPTGVIYALNPTAGEAVDPTVIGPYLDDELCQERFIDPNTGLLLLAPGTPRAPCGTGKGELMGGPGYYQAMNFTPAEIPNTGTAGALPFKWVRITNKQNQMGLLLNPAGAPQMVDATQPPGQQVCWDGTQEHVPPLGKNCSNFSVEPMNPVWLLTSLAITPNGSRRMTQMEVAFIPPPNVNATVSTKAPITLRGNLQVNGEDNCTCKPDGTPLPPALVCDKSRNAIYSGVKFPALGISQNGAPSETLTGVNGQTGLTVYNPATGQVTTPGATAQGPWPFNVPQLVKQFSAGAQPATGPPWNYTCAASTTGFPTCSGGSGQAFGTYPTGTLPAALGGGPDPSTGQSAIVYVPGSVRLTGNMTGDGVLIINGDLDVHGGMAFYGLILVTGAITFTGGGSQPVNLYGAILAGQDVHATDAIGGSFNFHYDSCALKRAAPPGPPQLIATHELIY